MRTPRDISKYEPAERIADWLERLAADIRRRDVPAGKVMRVDVQLRWWHPDWASKRKTERQARGIVEHAVSVQEAPK